MGGGVKKMNIELTPLLEYQTRIINEFRINNKVFTQKAFIEMLKRANIPTNTTAIGVFQKALLNQKIGNRRAGEKDVYSFKDESIHYKKIYNILLECKQKISKYNSVCSKEDKIQKAINLLKENGYIIKKRVITYEEV